MERKARLHALDLITAAACYAARGEFDKAKNHLERATNARDFGITLSTLANANDEGLDIEFSDMDSGVGLSQPAADVLEGFENWEDDEEPQVIADGGSDDDEDDAEDVNMFASDDDVEYSRKRKTKELSNDLDEDFELDFEFEDDEEDEDVAELAKSILSSFERDDQDDGEEKELSRAKEIAKRKREARMAHNRQLMSQ